MKTESEAPEARNLKILFSEKKVFPSPCANHQQSRAISLDVKLLLEFREINVEK